MATLYVKGLKSSTEESRQLLAVWDACIVAGIDPPEEVVDFFGDEYPEDTGAMEVVDLDAEKSTTDMSNHLTVDLSRIPKGVTKVRFTVNW